MLHIALRNLFQNRIRLTISVGGVALALSLMLALDAIFAGSEQRITAYIDHAGADVWVSQAGVHTMHMSSSSLPASVVEQVRAVPGVRSATPVLYLANTVAIGNERQAAYVIGVPAGAPVGGAWKVSKGEAIPTAGQAVVGETVASGAGVGLGDRVQILGQDFTIGGLSEGTAYVANSIVFVAFEDFIRLRGGVAAVSFVLVQVAPGESAEALRQRIAAAVPGVTVQTRQQFAAQERRVVRDMSTDVLTIMNSIGFLIGLAVVALTVYLASFTRRSEYGVLKALGARNGHLYRVVLWQALWSVGLGFVTAVLFTVLLTFAVPRLAANLELLITGAALLRVWLVSLVIAGLAAVLPVRQLAGIDPAVVFRGGGSR